MAKKASRKTSAAQKSVETITHAEDKRRNIPTVEYQSVVKQEQQQPVTVKYPRNVDIDPQLVWRGKDQQDWSDLVVHAPPLYIQEKVHPKVLIDDLLRQSQDIKDDEVRESGKDHQLELFSDFNGVPEGDAKTEFYQHDQNWTNRMILGDSLQVMASLAEREGLRGKVQCIYFDPPYGIKFNSNFQWSTTSRDVKDGKADHVTREPEQVKAFRDTWRDGIHSYLTYLRDRLTVAHDLLADSGSIFVQIGAENVHRIRAILDEVFGDENVVTEIVVKKKGSQKSSLMDPVNDFILWYAKSKRADRSTKFRTLYEERVLDGETVDEFSRIELPNRETVNLKSFTDINGDKLDFRAYPRRIEQQFPNSRLFRAWPITNGGERASQMDPVLFEGELTSPPKGRCWSHTSKPPTSGLSGMMRNLVAGRLVRSKTSLDFKRYLQDFPYKGISNWWDGLGGAPDQVYVVQTNERIVERCLLMASDPGDLVLDPTCGSGTTATVAERWGRRWITIDTSRVALALARARIMGARYPFYILSDSRDGQTKEAEITGRALHTAPSYGNIRYGFVYRRCAYITSGCIANNSEIDIIWEKWQEVVEPLRSKLNSLLKRKYEEWEIPREAENTWPTKAALVFQKILAEQQLGDDARPTKLKDLLSELNAELERKKPLTLDTLPERPADPWDEESTKIHSQWWTARIARQKEIDASIAAKAEFEYLYDKPYEDKKKVRVAGPFTVESLSPHRTLGVDENDDLIDNLKEQSGDYEKQSFPQMVLENLKVSGVQQAHKEDRINFTSLVAWPGDLVCAEAHYLEGETERRAAIFIGPEFGTVQRQDLVLAAREAGDANFDVLIACAFNFDAMSTEFNKLGRIPVLKARMNADLHMSDDLKNTGKGNLFVIFGEPDIDLITDDDGRIRVKINGVDVFHPNTGEVRSDRADGIACWFIDTDYNEESFFVRHAYFLGQNDPYTALKTTLKAEIDADAWSTLNSDTSRPFRKPKNGRIAVKVINHLGDEVMKVFRTC